MAKENQIKTFALRLDAAQMDAIQAWAADEFRSVNGQIQYILAEALRKSRRMPHQASHKSVEAEGRTESAD
ncbi:MAG: hypothetical protein RR485_07075 [Mucinivorans sp.]